ncbi:MAG: CBS domain-containing protein [Chloroflexi bacterium]|nr:CBS domain-containing protein [Chloroflexota bacterium]
MKVRDIMTTDVKIVSPDTPVQDIIRMFRDYAVSGLPVVDDEGKLVGIVTEMDLIRRHARPHAPIYFPILDARIPLGREREYRETVRRILATTAEELMTSPVQTVSPDMDVVDLATLMVERGINPVPVVEDGRLVGIVSRTDLLRVIEEFEVPSEDEEAA